MVRWMLAAIFKQIVLKAEIYSLQTYIKFIEVVVQVMDVFQGNTQKQNFTIIAL